MLELPRAFRPAFSHQHPRANYIESAQGGGIHFLPLHAVPMEEGGQDLNTRFVITLSEGCLRRAAAREVPDRRC